MAINLCGGVSVAAASAPQVTELIPLTVEQTTASIRAQINPGGKATTYHFEYGTGATFEKRIPATGELSVGSGAEPVAVTVSPTGLSEGTIYDYRIVATNAEGTTSVPVRKLSTLNDEGLAWGRRYELVSPLRKGASGQAGQGVIFGQGELLSQVSPDGNSLGYYISYGIPDSTYGGEIAYRASRGGGGWASTQVSPSLNGQHGSIISGEGNSYGKFNAWLSTDTSCAFSTSSVPFTDDPEALPVIEAGGYNLYRRNPDGSYDLVTNLPRTTLGDNGQFAPSAYENIAASEDCDRVVFETQFSYPGIPQTTGAQAGAGVNTWRIYEWEDGTLRNPVGIPGVSGTEYPATASAGNSSQNITTRWHALSEDGSRFYFTTDGAGTSTPLGRDAIFLREDGQPTKDVAVSQTATPNDGDSYFQMATPDGSEMFFLARYGLAGNATSTGATTCALTDGDNLGLGCDLYRYSAATGVLTDISASTNPEDTSGASVAGVLDASDDGSRVYFAAKGQLVPGKGQTFAENTTAGTRGYNIYLAKPGGLSFVANVTQANVSGSTTPSGLLVSSTQATQARAWASRTTPSGDHLVFQTDSKITGPSGTIEAYLYSAGEETVTCISCRRDGAPSLGSVANRTPLADVLEGSNDYNHPQRSLSDDGRVVFFEKRDPLATGAISGQPNLFEWRDEQISLLAHEVPGIGESIATYTRLLGVSSDGSSVFLRNRLPLVPWDTDGRNDIYVARVGGGFDPPPTPPADCDPLSEACQGTPPPGPGASHPGSSSIQGRGNEQSPPACKSSQVRRGGRCVSKLSVAKQRCAEREGKAKQRCIRKQVQQLNRTTNTDRGAGK